MNIPTPSITFEETQIEVACMRRGRPTYRWAQALYVVVDGNKHFPPMRAREAKRYAKEVQESARARAVHLGREDRQAGLPCRSSNGAYLEGWHSGPVAETGGAR